MAYVGLTPSENSSGERVRRGSIGPATEPRLRLLDHRNAQGAGQVRMAPISRTRVDRALTRPSACPVRVGVRMGDWPTDVDRRKRMMPNNATGNQSGTRLPAPLPRSAGAGEQSNCGVAARPVVVLPANPYRLRSHPACLPFADQLTTRPPEIGQLTSLTELWLGGHEFTTPGKPLPAPVAPSLFALRSARYSLVNHPTLFPRRRKRRTRCGTSGNPRTTL